MTKSSQMKIHTQHMKKKKDFDNMCLGQFEIAGEEQKQVWLQSPTGKGI